MLNINSSLPRLLNVEKRETAQKPFRGFVVQSSSNTTRVTRLSGIAALGAALSIFALEHISKILARTAPPSTNRGAKRQTVSEGYKSECNEPATSERSEVSSDERSEVESQPSYQIKHDWLQGTMEFTNVQSFYDAVEYVVGSFDDTPAWTPDKPTKNGFLLFAGSGRSVCGIRWGWNPPNKETGQKGHGFISIPGSVLGSVSGRNSWRVCLGLRHRWGFKCTRFDVAFDDFEKRVSFDTVLDAIDAGNYARFKNYSVTYSSSRGKQVGISIYMGSKDGDKRLVMYDKAVESGGKIDSHRFESRHRNDLADQIFRDYTSIETGDFEDLAPAFLGAVVFGTVDFVDKVSGDRLQRRVPLPWWQELTGLFGQLRFSRPRPPQTIKRKMEWLERQVAPIMRVFHEGFGRFGFQQYVEGLQASAEKRMSEHHLAMIQHIREQRPGTPEYERLCKNLARLGNVQVA